MEEPALAAAAPVPMPTPVSEPAIPSHFVTYTDEAGFFSISYPPEWETFSLGDNVPVAKDLFAIIDSTPGLSIDYLEGLFIVFEAKGTPLNVNVVVQPLSEMTARGWLTPNEIVEARLRRTEEIRQKYREFSRINTIIGGREAVIIDWENSYPDIGKKARTVQLFMIADNLVWKVTCVVDLEEYRTYKDDLFAIVRSLRILR